MIVRILIAGFASFVGGVYYLTGLTRLISALLTGFGGLLSLFFGAVFVIPDSENIPGFPVYGRDGGRPFFLLGLIPLGLALFILIKERVMPEYEDLSQVPSDPYMRLPWRNNVLG